MQPLAACLVQPLLPTSCVTLGKSLPCSPGFPRLSVVGNSFYSTGIVYGIIEYIPVSVLCAQKPYLSKGCFVERAQEGLAIIKYEIKFSFIACSWTIDISDSEVLVISVFIILFKKFSMYPQYSNNMTLKCFYKAV